MKSTVKRKIHQRGSTVYQCWQMEESASLKDRNYAIWKAERTKEGGKTIKAQRKCRTPLIRKTYMKWEGQNKRKGKEQKKIF